ncbi:hypothetical protein XENOCAPTIV_010654 [Xenoophorus captivus]|uniref:Uncharacterized protein n=1 Tax=Xenoophorus captivus TaxID=1517983 RepID=A0ABV0QZX7_9TELE
MASSSGPGFTFQANGEDNPRQVSGSGSSRRHLSDSESEICPTAKSLARLIGPTRFGSAQQTDASSSASVVQIVSASGGSVESNRAAADCRGNVGLFKSIFLLHIAVTEV